MDGIMESKSSGNSLDCYSVKFNQCRSIYPIRLIKPCDKYKFDVQKQLQEVLNDLNENNVVIDSAVFDNPKRSDVRCAKCASAKFACEYCVNCAESFVHINNKSMNMIQKKYEVKEKKLLEEIEKLEENEPDEEETDNLINLRQTLTTVQQEKEIELKKMGRKQLTWPKSTMEGNLRSLEDIREISNAIDNNPNIVKTNPDYCKGIKGKSLMLDQPNFHMIEDMPCEYMHIVCLGVVKRMVKLNFKVGENRPRKTKRKLSSPQLFNEKIKLVQLTREFSRRCRNLDFGVMKASEFRNLLLFFFTIVLDCIEDEFEDDKRIWLHLVYMIRACVLPNEEFRKINQVLINNACKNFYELYEELYGQINCTYSIHSVGSHLPLIRGNMPLTHKSAFKFESFFSELRNLFHPGTVSPLKQIIQNCYMKRILEYHICEKTIHYSPEKQTPTKENNSLVYTYNDDNICMYKIMERIDENSFNCKRQGKFTANFPLTPEYTWSDVGVFKIGPLSEESHVINVNSIKGKVLKVNGYLITCPANVLIEQ